MPALLIEAEPTEMFSRFTLSRFSLPDNLPRLSIIKFFADIFSAKDDQFQAGAATAVFYP